MAKAKNYTPEGAHSITPYLTIKGAAKAIEFYKNAFGATEVMRMAGPDGLIFHGHIRIGDSPVFLCDEMMGAKSPLSLGGSSVTILLYVPDADATWKKALAAGAQVGMPLEDQFWGDRYGMLTDPFGHAWAIATHQEDLTADEMAQRSKAAMEKAGKP
jgi:uncharacterized glyoxalase superfamily protein PhnB